MKLPFAFSPKLVASLIVVASVAAGLIIGLSFKSQTPGVSLVPEFVKKLPQIVTSSLKERKQEQARQEEVKLEKFGSKEEFLEYVSEAQKRALAFGGPTLARDFQAPDGLASPLAEASDGRGGGGGADRYSQTNVQVPGIDEPDIVKTNGEQIYFASSNTFIDYPLTEERLQGAVQTSPLVISPRPVPNYQPQVRVVKAFPPPELATKGRIDQYGELLLYQNILVVFSQNNQTVYGYDISSADAPKEVWKVEIPSGSYIVTARLSGDKIYLVTSTGFNYTDPCPIVPLVSKGSSLTIPCVEIYHPIAPVPADSTYTAAVLDPVNGEIKSRVSVVGSSGGGVVYMSPQSLYLSYPYSGDVFAFLLDFFSQSGLLPADTLARLSKIASYDLSDTSKISEFGVIMERYFATLSDDEQRRFENEVTNQLSDYAKIHGRDLVRTGIVRIGLEDFAIKSTGYVAGTLLNQFSLDEYHSHLRVATTIGEGGGFWGLGLAGQSSANDVYVLDADLKVVGSVKDLGLAERIFSVRFLEGRGYVVTFRQIDPFYVLDLSDPKSPKVAGELKIPGFSSYLDPIAPERVLGVGQEGSQVKLSLFDVSSAGTPLEADKYLLDAYWTDVSGNHHAFLADRDKKIFFLPAGGEAYIFSYSSDKLELKKVVTNILARRAVYINDYLYVVGDDRIVVLSEKDWQEVSQLKF